MSKNLKIPFLQPDLWPHLLIAVSLLLIAPIALGIQAVAAKGAQPTTFSVLTYHYDNARTGQNLQETTLTTANVNANQFGLLFSHPVIGGILAQPLYVPQVTIQGQVHNVLYVATTSDWVYAFDADSPSFTNPLWSTNLGLSGGPGIFGTPVIAETNGVGTLYVVTNDGKSSEHLHALNIATGQENSGSPVLIQAKGFNPALARERTGLLLYNGVVYGGWEGTEYISKVEHGWVLGFNATTLQLVSAFNTTPHNTLTRNPGSIWQSTTGLSADANGNIYPIVGNGPFDANTGKSDYGNSFVKLSTANKLKPVDYFTPFDQSCLLKNDQDLGSGGNLILPDQPGTAHLHLMLSGSKNGRLFLVDRDNLGKYTSDPSLRCNTPEENRTDIDHVVQETAPGFIPGLFMAPTYWLAPNGQQYIYLSGANPGSGRGDAVKAFQLNNGLLTLTPSSQTAETFGYPGAGLSVSSNGNQPGSGILWALQPGPCPRGGCTPSGPGILHAYDATNLGHELYNSTQNPARDAMTTNYVKFTLPVVANGKVYIGTQGSLYVYGLL